MISTRARHIFKGNLILADIDKGVSGITKKVANHYAKSIKEENK